MLSQKVKDYLIAEGLYDEADDKQYKKVILDLNIPLNTAFADLNLHTNVVNFSGKLRDLYNVCWFAINTNFELNIEATHKVLKLPEDYIPLDSFEAEGGFFYNRKTGEVLELELGQKLIDFQNGKLQPQWKDFNSFLEWYFDIE